ncbi:NASP, partial [Symbiodinium microadriaticum]
EEDEPSDMEIAWEALEVSRKIFETEGDPTHDEFLSEVYEALGDVSRFNGNFQGAIEEYKKCVQLREAALDDSDRLLAQAHYSLAVAYIYNAGEE